MHEGDFAYMIADVATGFVQNGNRTGLCTVVMDPTYMIDPTGNFSKLAAPLQTEGYDREVIKLTTVNNSTASRQWAYQFCTMFGFFQTPNKIYPLRSFDLELPYWHDFCKYIFDPALPATKDGWTNQYFGGLNIEGDNIFFFTASEDPWQYCGMRTIHNPAKQQNM